MFLFDNNDCVYIVSLSCCSVCIFHAVTPLVMFMFDFLHFVYFCYHTSLEETSSTSSPLPSVQHSTAQPFAEIRNTFSFPSFFVHFISLSGKLRNNIIIFVFLLFLPFLSWRRHSHITYKCFVLNILFTQNYNENFYINFSFLFRCCMFSTMFPTMSMDCRSFKGKCFFLFQNTNISPSAIPHLHSYPFWLSYSTPIYHQYSSGTLARQLNELFSDSQPPLRR